MAKANPFRFSTKYQDDETDLLYYGRRHYNSSTGRWLSRDPIEESGGLNIYAFVDNAPVRKVDIHGLAWKELETVDTVTGMTRRSFVGATDKENKVGTFIYPRRGACGCWRRNVYADFTPTLTITYQQYTETQKFEDDFSPTADALETAHQLELLVDALTGEGIGVATLFMSLLTGVETGLATHQDTVYITVTADYEKALRDKDAVSWSMSTTYFKKGEGKNISSTTCKPKLTMLNAAQIRSLESGLTQDYSRSGAMPWDLSTDPVRLTHPKVTVSN
jgi:RHS repeat-associated protein